MANMLATFAEFEREMISIRTKEAMAAAKTSRGTRYGRPRLVSTALVRRIVRAREGGESFGAIARKLTARGHPLPRRSARLAGATVRRIYNTAVARRRVRDGAHPQARHRQAPERSGRSRQYEVRWTEATVNPTAAQEALQAGDLPDEGGGGAPPAEIENATATGARVVDRAEREEPFATYAALWVGEARDAVALGDLKARSIADREGTLRRYILPGSRLRPIGAITRADAREFRSSLIARGLAPATVKGAFDAFRRVLDLAVDNGVLVANPAVLRRKPGGNRTRHAPDSSTGRCPRRSWARSSRRPRDELDALVILFCAYTGVRAAELAGLNIGDVRARHDLGRPDPEAHRRRVDRGHPEVRQVHPPHPAAAVARRPS